MHRHTQIVKTVQNIKFIALNFALFHMKILEFAINEKKSLRKIAE